MSATPPDTGRARRPRPLVEAARLARPRLPQLQAAVALGAGAAIALLATSGYLISRAAERPAMLTLLVTIVAVRVFGMARAGLRYGERLVSHDLAFRVLADLRVRFFRRLLAAFPDSGRAGRGDLLSRFVGDVEALQHLYLRGVAPRWWPRWRSSGRSRPPRRCCRRRRSCSEPRFSSPPSACLAWSGRWRG